MSDQINGGTSPEVIPENIGQPVAAQTTSALADKVADAAIAPLGRDLVLTTESNSAEDILRILDTEHVLSPDQFEQLLRVHGWSRAGRIPDNQPGLMDTYFSEHLRIWVVTGLELDPEYPDKIDLGLCTLWMKQAGSDPSKQETNLTVLEIAKVEPYGFFLKPQGFVHTTQVDQFHQVYRNAWYQPGSRILVRLQKIEYGSRYGKRWLKYHYNFFGPADVVEGEVATRRLEG